MSMQMPIQMFQREKNRKEKRAHIVEKERNKLRHKEIRKGILSLSQYHDFRIFKEKVRLGIFFRAMTQISFRFTVQDRRALDCAARKHEKKNFFRRFPSFAKTSHRNHLLTLSPPFPLSPFHFVSPRFQGTHFISLRFRGTHPCLMPAASMLRTPRNLRIKARGGLFHI